MVLEEFRRSKDSPDHEIAERLFDLTFTTHPYRRPIIGFEETVRPIRREDMLRVFNTWYVPNNMVFVAVGDFDSDTMLRTVEDRFGGVPAAPLPVRPRADEPTQAQPRVLAFPFRAELARVEIALPSVEATDPQVPALDLLRRPAGLGLQLHPVHRPQAPPPAGARRVRLQLHPLRPRCVPARRHLHDG